VAELARAADEGGYSSLWVMDHLYQLDPFGGPDQPMLESYTTLGALAAITERVMLGTLVSGVTYRNPALLAKQVTTLDVISQGRAWLGIGAAWHEAEHIAHGYRFPPIKERLDRLEEAAQICRAMFRSDGASFEGTHYRIANVRHIPRPVQPGGPPIMIAGGGEKRTLKLVAQYGDACNFSGDVATTRHKIEVLRRHCDAVGRDPSEISVTRLSTLLLAADDTQAGQLKQMIADAAGADRVAQMNVGTADQIAEQVRELADAGVDELIFNMPGAQPDQIREMAELLSEALG
jgi:F420-dependent oxidoreductase-like protein